MNKGEQLTPEGIVKYFQDEFKSDVKKAVVRTRAAGSKKNKTTSIWLKIDKTCFKDFVKKLCELQFPHLSVVSGNDLGETIELIYHFTLNSGERFKEVNLNISVELPRSKPEIETICDLIPGALVTEREKQEFLGVKIVGIPDSRRLFLPEDFPEGVYPWRRDETGDLGKVYRNLHEVDK